VALEAGLSPVFVVVSPHVFVQSVPTGVMLVVNRDAEEGIASSIRFGLAAVIADGADVTGVTILACDQPAVTAEHLRELATGGNEVVASAYAGRNGVPAYFPNAAFDGLLALRGDVGARAMLHDVRALPLAWGEIDVDTIQDLERARKLYGS
jgi:CTP:molybdopterin cytidylyltransferase MocA